MLISRAIKNESVEIWGDGSVVRDYIFVDDVIDALEAAMGDQSSARIFNIGTGRGRSLFEVIGAVEDQIRLSRRDCNRRSSGGNLRGDRCKEDTMEDFKVTTTCAANPLVVRQTAKLLAPLRQ